LATVLPSALTKACAKSLAARGRTDLRLREEAEDWLRKGLEFRQQGIDETHASFESAQQALDTEVAVGQCISPEEKFAFFNKHFLSDPHHRREQAVAYFERGLQMSPTHSELQFRLGEAYFNEWGVPRNPEKAAILFSKAADSGFAEAQFYLGWICAGMVGSDGSGFPQDNVQATNWWRKGAEQGHADSQHYLGEYYACGWGVEQNYAQAAFWIRKAAEQLRDDEPKQLRLYSDLASWLRIAAERGITDAQYLLGWLYHHGRDVPQDRERAARWYRMAAEQGDAESEYCLGVLYDNGEGVPEDSVQAATWLRKAAEQGNVDAQFALGLAYKTGHGVPQDEAQAAIWLKRASDEVHADADPHQRKFT
jgi:TPR repeat protein